MANLPPPLEVAVLKTLAKDPDERFFDFSLFLEAIQSVLSPPPAFPLFRSTYSRKKRTISHAVPSTNTEIISSPIRKHASRRAVTQAPERSGTPSGSEACALMSEYLTDEQAIDTPITQQEPEAIWLPDPFGEEEGDRLPVRAAVLSTDEHSETLLDKTASSLKKRTHRHGSVTVLVKYSKRRSLELGLLLSVIMAVVCSALWLSGIIPFETASPLPTETSQSSGAHLSPHLTIPISLRIPTNRSSAIPTAIPTARFSQNGSIANSTPHAKNANSISNATYQSSNTPTAPANPSLTPTATPANSDPYPPRGRWGLNFF